MAAGHGVGRERFDGEEVIKVVSANYALSQLSSIPRWLDLVGPQRFSLTASFRIARFIAYQRGNDL